MLHLHANARLDVEGGPVASTEPESEDCLTWLATDLPAVRLDGYSIAFLLVQTLRGDVPEINYS